MCGGVTVEQGLEEAVLCSEGEAAQRQVCKAVGSRCWAACSTSWRIGRPPVEHGAAAAVGRAQHYKSHMASVLFKDPRFLQVRAKKVSTWQVEQFFPCFNCVIVLTKTSLE